MGFWAELLCRLFGHRPGPPDENCSFEIVPGLYYPFHMCLRCRRMLKRNPDRKSDGTKRQWAV